jgi:hypothetical protein
MDISQTTAPKSDQQNFDDYISGPKTVTISEVRAGSDEQPVDIHLVEFPGRPFKPSKSMRRVLVAAWGPDASAYVGRRMVLFGDPTIRFGGAVVGGIRISNLSHIDKPLTISLTTTRGKRAPYVVKPLASEPATILPVNPPKQMVSAQQLSDLAKAFEANGINDRAAGLAYIGDVIKREVGSSKELTREEAAAVLDDLKSAPATDADAEPTLDGVA